MRAIATFSFSKLTAHLSHRGHLTAVEYDAAHVGIDKSYCVTPWIVKRLDWKLADATGSNHG